MSGYLARYIAGDHEAVWEELCSLGPAVEDDAVRADALAVAHETMTRVRSNVELIAARLADIEYRFESAWNPGTHEPVAPVVGAPRPDRGPTWTELASHGVHLPLSLRAFYEVVGSVNFAGIHVPPEELADMRPGEHWTKYYGPGDGAADPLHVTGFDDALDDFLCGDWVASTRSYQRYTWDSPELREQTWLISPDELHLYGFSGGDSLDIGVSTPAADGIVGVMAEYGPPFVEHLRDHILRRAGFRWEDDEEVDVSNPMPLAVRDRLLDDLRPF